MASSFERTDIGIRHPSPKEVYLLQRDKGQGIRDKDRKCVWDDREREGNKGEVEVHACSCACVCMFMCTRVHVCACIYAHVYAFACMWGCMHVGVRRQRP